MCHTNISPLINIYILEKNSLTEKRIERSFFTVRKIISREFSQNELSHWIIGYVPNFALQNNVKIVLKFGVQLLIGIYFKRAVPQAAFENSLPVLKMYSSCCRNCTFSVLAVNFGTQP